MRIIITKNGKESLKAIKKEIVASDLAINKYIRNDSIKNSDSKRFLSPIPKPTKTKGNISTIRKSPKVTSTTNIDTILSMNSPDRIIYINQKRVNLPKNIAEKYAQRNDTEDKEEIKDHVNFILPELPDRLYSKSPIETNLPKNFSLKNIFGDTNIKKLKHKMKEEKKMKDRHFVMSPVSMRSPIVTKTADEQLDQDLVNTEINCNKLNLIKYLANKNSQNFSEKTINKIANFNEQKMNKINKLCQISEHKDENLDEINKRIHKKVHLSMQMLRVSLKKIWRWLVRINTTAIKF